MSFDRVILGSAQFGFNYGVTNEAGQVVPEEVQKILSVAKGRGVSFVDTSPLYGNSEAVLGQASQGLHFEYITKYARIPQTVFRKEQVNHILASVKTSVSRLGSSTLEGLLAHDVTEFFNHKEAYLEAATILKQERLIRKFGVSVYSPEQALRALEIFHPDIVQFPLNIVDQRFLTEGVISRLREEGVENHCRSVFLQGILLQKPDELDPYLEFFKGTFTDYLASIKAMGLTQEQAALKFVSQEPGIDKILIGVCSSMQLVEVLGSFLSPSSKIDFGRWATTDQRLINPLSWPMLKRG